MTNRGSQPSGTIGMECYTNGYVDLQSEEKGGGSLNDACDRVVRMRSSEGLPSKGWRMPLIDFLMLALHKWSV